MWIKACVAFYKKKTSKIMYSILKCFDSIDLKKTNLYKIKFFLIYSYKS